MLNCIRYFSVKHFSAKETCQKISEGPPRPPPPELLVVLLVLDLVIVLALFLTQTPSFHLRNWTSCCSPWFRSCRSSCPFFTPTPSFPAIARNPYFLPFQTPSSPPPSPSLQRNLLVNVLDLVAVDHTPPIFGNWTYTKKLNLIIITTIIMQLILEKYHPYRRTQIWLIRRWRPWMHSSE